MRADANDRTNQAVAWLIGPLFALVAAWLFFGGSAIEQPPIDGVTVAAADISTAPRRSILGDPPTIKIDGFDRTCMDCHRIFKASSDPPPHLMQHAHIQLRHGINDRCRNCHDVDDRNLLVLHGGEKIPYSRVTELCAKCHGPTYRDWQQGMHGRTNGYWDASRGPSVRVSCTECHDPHNPNSPAMDSISPLPRPRTLRMGDQMRKDEYHRAEPDRLRDVLRSAHRRDVAPPTTRPSDEYEEEHP